MLATTAFPKSRLTFSHLHIPNFLAPDGLSILQSYAYALLVETNVTDNWHDKRMYQVIAIHGLEMHSCAANTPSCLIRGLSPAAFYKLVAHTCVKTASEVVCNNANVASSGYTRPERKIFFPYRMRQN